MNEVYQEMRKSLKEYGKKNINLIQLVEKTYRPFVVKNGHQRCLHIYHKHSLDNQQREIQRLAAKSYLKWSAISEDLWASKKTKDLFEAWVNSNR